MKRDNFKGMSEFIVAQLRWGFNAQQRIEQTQDCTVEKRDNFKGLSE